MADVDEIEQQIKSDRTALRRNIQELEDRAHAAADWRTHYQSHAGAALAAAFAGGVILGSVAHRRRLTETSRRSMLEAIDPSGRATHQVSDLWRQVVESIIGVAGAAAIEGLSQFLPGFREQFDARTSGRRV